jgi:hypothetical protein
LLEPGRVKPVKNKLSRQDAGIVKGLAVYATQDDKKYIVDQLRTVRRQVKEKILGVVYMQPGIKIDETEDIDMAHKADRYIMSAFLAAETDAEKLNILNPDSKDYIYDRALNAVLGDKKEPEYVDLFKPSGGSGKSVGEKRLW